MEESVLKPVQIVTHTKSDRIYPISEFNPAEHSLAYANIPDDYLFFIRLKCDLEIINVFEFFDELKLQILNSAGELVHAVDVKTYNRVYEGERFQSSVLDIRDDDRFKLFEGIQFKINTGGTELTMSIFPYKKGQ